MIDAQRQVYSAVNAAMVTVYWNIGKALYEARGEATAPPMESRF